MHPTETNQEAFERLEMQAVFTRIEAMLRRRIRAKFRSLDHAAYDVDDVLASTRRRIDRALADGSMHHRNDAESISYIQHVAENVARNAIRTNIRERKRRKALGDLQVVITAKSAAAEADDDSTRLVEAQLDPVTRTALSLRLRGFSHRAIARILGIRFEAYKTRMRRIRARVGKLLRPDESRHHPRRAGQ